MEPQVTICCNKRDKKCCCLYRVLYTIIGLFAFVIGIIIGAQTTIVATIGAVYFYAIATTLIILALIALIYIWCSCRN